MKKTLFILALLSAQAQAVVINPKGTGEFLLIPYYTVNNDLNTLVSISNTTNDAKAIKINFREGLNGHAVLSYNVYLDAYDAWTFALVASPSTVGGFNGQPSVLHLSSDVSCAPFLVKSGQEFLPFELTDGLQNMQRVREGYIEVIEMAELGDGLADALDFQPGSDLWTNCGAIEEAWTNGFWPNEVGQTAPQEMEPASGGISAEANIINVAEGINYSIPVTALADFFADGTIAHSNPGDTSLSFDAAASEAVVVTEDGAYDLDFNSGIDAVSSLFMAERLFSNYDLLEILASESETILTQPTRRFYLNQDGQTAAAPFSNLAVPDNCGPDNYGGSAIDLTVFDREGYADLPEGSIPMPISTEIGICGAVFSYSLSLTATDASQSSLTGSQNFLSVVVGFDQAFTENGMVVTDIEGDGFITAQEDDDQTVKINGTPVVGISLQKYTNANAVPGLLAQFGSGHAIKSSTRVVED